MTVLTWTWGQGFLLKNFSQKSDKTLFLSADYDDIQFYGKEILPGQLKARGISGVMAPTEMGEKEELTLRHSGLIIVWKLSDDLNWDQFSARFRDGDGVVVSGENLINRPFFPKAVADLVIARKGFAVLMEFSPLHSSKTFYSDLPASSVIKGHVIGTRETRVPHLSLWRARLIRAVSERWVRFVCVRFSSGLSMDQNLAFQENIIENFIQRGFDFHCTASRTVEFFLYKFKHTSIRLLMILLISILTPLMIVSWIQTFPMKSTLLFFSLSSMLSMFSGVVIAGLGAVPDIVLGLTPFRGVKLQLLLPLVISLGFLLSPVEWRRLFKTTIQVKHVFWLGLGGGVLVFLYLSRSGNSPFISVSDGERGLRDLFESSLGARPRFKEFLFGHPLFILGLFVSNYMPKNKNFFSDGRFFLWLGLIGQISILNTFTHFYTPVELSLLRSAHGIWLGGIVALPLCLLYRRMSAE